MKYVRFVLLVALFSLIPAMWAADSPWQPARIVTIKTTTNSRTAAWVVNTPIEDEEHVCYITVQYKDKVVKGSYVLGKAQPEPPPEWVKHVPVRLQLVGDTMFLKAVTGEEYRLHVESTKSGPMMDPLTPEELAAAKTAAAHDEPQSNSMIGFDQPEAPAKPAPPSAQQEAPPQPGPQPPETTGTVSVSSTPFLADLYVDGENMGYTPAKLKLVPGKHTFRCEKQGYKPWTKEITLTIGSELTLDATLDRK